MTLYKTFGNGSENVPHSCKTISNDLSNDKLAYKIEIDANCPTEEFKTTKKNDEKDTVLVWKTKINDYDSNSVNHNHHNRMSSLDSTASDSGTSNHGTLRDSIMGSRASSISNLKDSQYGSVTSLASTTSLISPQELQQLIDEANQSLEGEDQSGINILVVVLHREYKSNGNIGITLAGGSDCETKEITVSFSINLFIFRLHISES